MSKALFYILSPFYHEAQSATYPFGCGLPTRKRAKTRARLDELKKPKALPREKPPTNFSFKPTAFDLPLLIPSVTKDSPLGFDKFIGRNPFYLLTEPSIFSYPPSSSFSSFFLSLADCSLSQLYLKPDTISSSTWQQILNSFTLYLLDFKYSSTFLSKVCRVLISGGCYAFSPQLSSSFAVFLPYLPYLWACQFGFTQFISSFPSLPSRPPTIALVEQLTQSYQTHTNGLKTIMLLDVESFSAWWFVRFDDLISYYPSSLGT